MTVTRRQYSFCEIQYHPATNFQAPGTLLGMSGGLQRFKLVKITAKNSPKFSILSEGNNVDMYAGQDSERQRR